MPILKQLVSGSSQTKRRSRMDLTREMISAPLGDFRHTMHVGRSGDAFGDTSFLSSRSGEPPGTAETTSFPRSPRPGLLSRTFRSSKRSQSVTRVDEQTPTYVKNAMSLPFLNDQDRGDGAAARSLSSSPFQQHGEVDVQRPSNGATAAAHFLELQEKNFGELTELPEPPQLYGSGMKHAESVMSFHVDLGPSMLGDILGVMEKEDDDLGYEEGKNSEGRASPALSGGHVEDEDGVKAEGGGDEEEGEVAEEEEEDVGGGEEAEEEKVGVLPAVSVHVVPEAGGPFTPESTPELLPKHLQHLDSSSVSSTGSAAAGEDKPGDHVPAGDADSATFSAPPEEEEEEEEEEGESNFSSFLEDEDDEIRV